MLCLKLQNSTKRHNYGNGNGTDEELQDGAFKNSGTNNNTIEGGSKELHAFTESSILMFFGYVCLSIVGMVFFCI